MEPTSPRMEGDREGTGTRGVEPLRDLGVCDTVDEDVATVSLDDIDGTGGGGEYSARSRSFALNKRMNPLFLRCTIRAGTLLPVPSAGIGGRMPKSAFAFPPPALVERNRESVSALA